MQRNDFWTTVRQRDVRSGAFGGAGALRASLLFAGLAVLATLLVTPLLASRDISLATRTARLDRMTTGSIGAGVTDGAYTVRRSVTQPMPAVLCIVGTGRKDTCR
ncbi:hypothetical protein [Pararhizobium mangrovi]|uniref:Uncharacterized protein n=1 Tax=Pararhizobium mangrovi TaxID=2590452 RepID=A0A506U0E4_9HYPH|nr:hypothetical protein [Pararhizobium mangrovi]TPW26059.1 hypothetical protein FJU11_16325 [Pararhizobium mangrovi]